MNQSSLPIVKRVLKTKLATLEHKLNTNINEKQALELEINEEAEKIKRIRESLEKLEDVCKE